MQPLRDEVSSDGPAHTRRRWLALALFGLALGWFEGAVVVYLREIVYPQGFAFPLAPLPARLLVVEIVREASSLIVLATTAWLAGATSLQRFSAFLVIFGLWDLAYYATLWLALGWPDSPATLDVLFLIPSPWVGPVWAPSLVAALFVAAGSYVFLTPDRVRAYSRRDWAIECLAGLLIVLSFVTSEEALTTSSPTAFRPWLYGVGLALGVGWFAYAEWLRGGAPVAPTRTPSPRGGPKGSALRTETEESR